MYSYEILSYLQRQNNSLTVKELNKIMATSPQALYHVVGEGDKCILIKIEFDDIDSNIEVRVIG